MASRGWKGLIPWWGCKGEGGIKGRLSVPFGTTWPPDQDSRLDWSSAVNG